MKNWMKNNQKRITAGIGILILTALVIIGIFAVQNGRTERKNEVSSAGEIPKDTDIEDKEQTEAKHSEKQQGTSPEEGSEKIEPAGITEVLQDKESLSADTENSAIQPATERKADNEKLAENQQQDRGNAAALKVSGSNLTDAAGNAVQLKGISTHGIAWFPDYINRECFRQLHEDFGINAIRLAMYTAEYHGYCTDGDKEYLKGLLDKGVQYAAENNMYVIIDWHILSDGNPNTYKEEAKDFFARTAEKYASHHNVLYEICNEPNGGVSWGEIKSYAREIIGIIRQYDSDAVIIVGTPNWSQYVDQALADPLTEYQNIMYALHFYAATHTDSLRNTLSNAVQGGLPVLVSEFGICDATGNGSIDEEQSAAWIQLLNQYKISYMMWNLSNKAETSSILQSSCTKVSGFTEEDLSESGKWFLRMMNGRIALPEGNQQGDGFEQKTQEPAAQNEQTSPVVQKKQEVTVKNSATVVNSWESSGESFYQYEVAVTNESGGSCSSWNTNIQFNQDFKLSDSWNGDFTVSGTTLQIKSKDYNGAMENGASQGNIGFIVSGSNKLKVK